MLQKILSLGVMTGTSCDGADLALLSLRKSGGRVTETLVAYAGYKYPKELRKRMRLAQTGVLRVSPLLVLQRDYSLWVGETCAQFLRKKGVPLQNLVIGVHGQTVWHEPEEGISAQLIDPSIVAMLTGCTVVSSFRQSDLARGGQGAPLVPLYHWIRAQESPFREMIPFAIHNVGGIANLTVIEKKRDQTMAFDTGPGNALIDLATERATNGLKLFDKDGKIASQHLGQLNWKVIELAARHPYFVKNPPKSTGRELFNESFLRHFHAQGEKLVAKATAFTAHTMALAYSRFVLKRIPHLNLVFVAGGGAKNPTLLKLFSRELARLTKKEILVSPLPEEFCPPQALEAAAFARLAFEALHADSQHPISLACVTGGRTNSFGASIFPGKNFRAFY